MKKLEKFVVRVFNNKLSISTIALGIVSFIAYIIIFFYLRSKESSIDYILSISADYVTVVSCVLVLIQLFAFVKDSRRKEFRSRKEAAYNIAREYAQDVLSRITFIQNVLSLSYNQDDCRELEKITSQAKISSFKDSDMRNNPCYKAYVERFMDFNTDPLALNVVVNLSVSSNTPGFTDILSIEEDSIKKHIANIRFFSSLMNTLNVLEYFAMSVNQNVSDSEMLFASLHQTFLKFVRIVYPFICYQNVEEETFYPNIIKLFYSWSEAQEADVLLKKELESKKERKIQKHKKIGKPL